MATHDDQLPPPDTVFRNAGPFSSYYGSKTASTLPERVRQEDPVRRSRATPASSCAPPTARASTPARACRVAITDAYASPTIAYDAAHLRQAQRRRGVQDGPAAPGRCPADVHDSADECDAVRLVRRGDPRRRGRARGRAGREHHVRRRRVLHDDDLLDSLGNGRRQPPGRHRLQLVGRRRGRRRRPDLAAAYDQVFQLGAVEGIGFYFSSGDNGDEVANTGTKQVDTPANSAWVTAVGGTSLAVGKNDKYLWETGWGTEQGPAVGRRQELDGLPRRRSPPARAAAPARLSPSRSTRRVSCPNALAKANGAHRQPRRPGHLGDRRPEHRLPGRPDADLPGRGGKLQRVPHRRHLAGLAGHRGRPGAGPAGARRQGDRLRQPGDLRASTARRRYHDVTDNPHGPARASPWPASTSSTATTPADGLITSVRTLGKDSSLSAREGLRRRHRRGHARRAATSVVPAPLTSARGPGWCGVTHTTPSRRTDDYTGRRASTTSRPESDRRHRRRPRRQRRVDRPLDPALRRAGRAPRGVPRDGADRLPRRGPGAAVVLRGGLARPRCARSPARLADEGFGELPVVVGYLDRSEHAQPKYGQPAGAPQNAAAVLHRGEVRPELRQAPPAQLRRLRRVPLLRAGRHHAGRAGARRRRRARHLRGPLAGRRPRPGRPRGAGPGCCCPSTPRRTSATRTTPGWSWSASGPRRPAAPRRTWR